MTAFLDVRTALTTVQDALVRTIQLGYGQRLPALADLDALRAATTPGVLQRALRYITSEGVVYRFEQFSRSAHLPPAVVKPTDRTGIGAWHRQSSTVTLGPAYFRPLHRVQTGCLRTVGIFEGEEEEDLERIYGQAPAVLVESFLDELESNAYQQGCIYKAKYSFAVHVFSRNLRTGPEAMQGSEIASEAAADPGLNRIIGDLRYLLAGCKLDLWPGVTFVSIDGKAQIDRAELANRFFKATIPITVHASFNIVDEDLVTPTEVWIQTQRVGTGQEDIFDTSNFVQSGFVISPQSGLTAVPAPGAAVVADQIVTIAPGAWTFAASSDTYRDLGRDGSLTYQSVAIDAPAPLQPANTLRIGMTRTSADSIVADVLLCAYAINDRDQFRAYP